LLAKNIAVCFANNIALNKVQNIALRLAQYIAFLNNMKNRNNKNPAGFFLRAF